VLESMKMETVIPAPFPARVRELLVAAGSQVETGAPLLRLEPTGDTEDVTSADPTGDAPDLDLQAPQDADDLHARAAEGRRALGAMLLGYDLDPGHEERTLAAYLGARDALAASGQPSVAAETELLAVLADVAELSRNRPVEGEAHLENRVHSPREHFHTYLQTLDPERGGLPAAFVTRLERVLAHHGVVGTERTPQLEQAVFRVFLAQQRSAPEVTMATSLLQRWLTEPAPEPPHDVATRDVLDRLVAATQVRFPVVGDLARSVRFRWFDQPLVDADRAVVLGSVDDELDAIDASTGAARIARVDALAGIPERIVRFLAARLRRGVREREPMLEVLVKRHYREYQLHGLTERAEDGRAVATASYRLDERDSYLVSTVATVDELTADSALAGTLERLVAARPPGHEGVVDLYLHWGDAPTDGAAAASALGERLTRMPFTQVVRRVAVGVVTDDDREVAYATFRPQRDGSLPEDLPVRGVHPMVGRRLNLWRLRDFDITRLDAPEDVLLLRAVARGNPHDQRLVALAQVRQLVVGRDDRGRLTGLPHVERALATCMEAVRRARTAAPDIRYDMNHVWLHIWPPVEADLDQLTALQAKVAPMTAGAGVEEVRVEGRVAGDRGHTVPVCARFWYQPGSGVTFTVEQPPTTRLAPLDAYAEKVVRA
ncbi:MAG: biotin/lipoyl-containing protein, partial [Dermatophilaceae bacterium]